MQIETKHPDKLVSASRQFPVTLNLIALSLALQKKPSVFGSSRSHCATFQNFIVLKRVYSLFSFRFRLFNTSSKQLK